MEHGASSHIGVHKLAHFAGFTFHMDTLTMTWLTMAIIILIAFLVTRNLKLAPQSGMQHLLEMIVTALTEQLDSSAGPKGRMVAPLVITLFVFLLVSNWLGLVPGFTSPTNDLNTTLGLALMVVIFVHVLGVYRKGLKYFKHFIEPYPVFLPINIIEELAKPVTLSFRLFGNILAGEILLVILGMLLSSSIFGYIVPSGWLLFSVVVGVIQAFIFTMLSISYLSGVLKDDHH